VLDVNANSPRWSAQDDRIVYLSTPTNSYNDGGGSATVINTNGSGRKVFGAYFSPGMSWSPDGLYVVGRASDETLRVVRVSDGAAVDLHFLVGSVCCHDYFQPDWR
jgi:WD40 repeat protein